MSQPLKVNVKLKHFAHAERRLYDFFSTIEPTRWVNEPSIHPMMRQKQTYLSVLVRYREYIYV